MKIHLLTGLPGSGKTYLGTQIADWLAGEGEESLSILLDDFNNLDDLVKVIGKKHIIITDVFLCRSKDREKAIKSFKDIAPDYELEWIFFENNPEKCLRNVEYRNDGRKVVQMIKDLSKIYTIPAGYIPREIWNNV